MTNEAVRSICRSCHGGCGVLLIPGNRDEFTVAGDPENPNNRGFLCAKGRAAPALARHPDRLTRPLRRVGSRGSGEFEEIDWEEALDTIAARLRADLAGAGPRSIVLAQGTDRNYQEWLFRFGNALGTPNVIGPAHVCFYPRVMAGILSMGAFSFVDYEGGPELVVLWGSNKPATHGDGVIGTRLLDAVSRGTRLIVVDPVRTPVARRAELHLQLRPGTDTALALALLHEIVEQGLEEREFVSRYATGAEELRAHVREWTPERAAGITGVPADLIRRAATAYGTAASAGIELGTGAQQSRDSFGTARLLVQLSGLCGNVDVPGGDVLWEPPGIIGRRAMPGYDLLPDGAGGDRLVAGHSILGMSGWAHPGAVFDACLTGEPYPVNSLLIFGSNLLVSYADSAKVEAALRAVPFIVAADLFLTPTVRYADIVLPVPSWTERDQIVEHANYVASRNRVVDPLGESRPDEAILNELAHRLGLEGFWDSAQDALDARLAPIGMDWKALQAQQYRATGLRYRKYEQEGFRTRSGKFTFHHPGLRMMGYDPLPGWTDREQPDEDHPLILTSRHSTFYFNSEFRQVGQLREKEPHPRAELSPRAAADRGLADGAWAAVTRHDRAAYFRVKVTDRLRDDSVCVSASWWYPELDGPDSWRLSNVNLLTTDAGSNAEMGSSDLRGCTCQVRPLTPEEHGRLAGLLGI
ncbi:molybdopterin-dependent oxidoreductase [Kitasatospora sp. NPDC001309]|uniref:molybdopterin-containing oxidoreductase family protein n=1 Tax=Kitasatospora sp. NPDC001309 TaxID=3364013 RepID=UPI0036C60024